MRRLSQEYRVLIMFSSILLVIGFLGLACSSETISVKPTPTAMVCVPMGAVETAAAFVASLPAETRQAAENLLTQKATFVPQDICSTATPGPDLDASMAAALNWTQDANETSQP